MTTNSKGASSCNTGSYGCSRWRRTQDIGNEFEDSWTRGELCSLQDREKWKLLQNLRIEDAVLTKQDNERIFARCMDKRKDNFENISGITLAGNNDDSMKSYVRRRVSKLLLNMENIAGFRLPEGETCVFASK